MRGAAAAGKVGTAEDVAVERGEDKLSLRDVSSGGERKVNILRDVFPIREDS